MTDDPRSEEHSPRSAAVLLSDALGHIDMIEPAGAREPIRQMFRAAIEQCAVSRSLLGKPLNHTLWLAQVLCDAAGMAVEDGTHEPTPPTRETL